LINFKEFLISGILLLRDLQKKLQPKISSHLVSRKRASALLFSIKPWPKPSLRALIPIASSTKKMEQQNVVPPELCKVWPTLQHSIDLKEA
jgi:hypothetical protein